MADQRSVAFFTQNGKDSYFPYTHSADADSGQSDREVIEAILGSGPLADSPLKIVRVATSQILEGEQTTDKAALAQSTGHNYSPNAMLRPENLPEGIQYFADTNGVSRCRDTEKPEAAIA